MNESNFQGMSRKELLAYMLAHREDDESFRTYMDKVHAESPTEVYPAPQSIDVETFSAVVRKTS